MTEADFSGTEPPSAADPTVTWSHVWTWSLIAGGTIAATALLSWASYTHLVRARSDEVGALGTALGVGSLFAGFLGFGFTLWQLAKTARAADEVSRAIKQVKNDYASLNVLAELGTARGVNEAIRKNLSDQDRLGAKDNYNRLRESLVKISSASIGLSGIIVEAFKDGAANVIDAQNTLRTVLDNDAVPWSSMIQELEQMDSIFISAGQSLRDTVRG